MALPSWHYPEKCSLSEISSLSKRVRDVLGDYGEQGGINLVEEEWLLQKEHCAMYDGLVATYPSLPLTQPIKVPYDYEDPCIPSVTRIRKQWRHDYIRMKRVLHYMRAKMKQNPTYKKPVEELKNALDRGSDIDSASLPKWLKGIVSKDSFMRTDIPMLYNSKYNGGLLTTVSLSGMSDDALLIAAAPTKSKISIYPVDMEDERLCLKVGCDVATSNAMFELDATAVSQTGFIGARHNSACHLWQLRNREGRLDVQSMWEVERNGSKPTSLCVSPYIGGEMMTCWDDGQINIDHEDYSEVVLKDRQTRFAVAGPVWYRADYGPTPRSILVTDRTAMDLVDMRTGRTNEMEIFAIPSQYCLNDELIRASCRLPENAFYHYVATDYRIFMFDVRMPRYVVLQMSPSLRDVPQYMHILPSIDADEPHHVIVANQSPRETLVYPVTCAGDVPPRLTSVPWRVAQIEDFMYMCDMENLETRSPLVRRFLDYSLAGVTAFHTEYGVSVVQMLSTGDLFHQDYAPATTAGLDRTMAAGLDRPRLEDEDVLAYCKSWLEREEKLVDEATEEVRLSERFHVVDASSVLEATRNRFVPHDSCPMCQEHPQLRNTTIAGAGDTTTSDTNSSGIKEDLDEKAVLEETVGEEGMCMQCGLGLAEAAKLKRRIDQEVLSERANSGELIEEMLETLQPPNPDLYSDPQSRILTKLWRDDYDIANEIEDRFQLLEIDRKKRYGDDYRIRYRIDAPEEPKPDPDAEPALTDGVVPEKRSRLDDLPPLGDTPKLEPPQPKLEPRVSVSEFEVPIDKEMEILSTYDQGDESLAERRLLESESDFDEAELEMFNMSTIPGSFSFLPSTR